MTALAMNQRSSMETLKVCGQALCITVQMDIPGSRRKRNVHQLLQQHWAKVWEWIRQWTPFRTDVTLEWIFGPFISTPAKKVCGVEWLLCARGPTHVKM